MASFPEVVALLYRADWTRLSMSAQVNTGFDPSLHLKSGYAARPYGAH
jgi:hypothetical protein